MVVVCPTRHLHCAPGLWPCLAEFRRGRACRSAPATDSACAEARQGRCRMTSEQSETPVLDVRGLSVEYMSEHGVVHAVTDVSFALRRGEVLGLAGESGSGKSTLAYAAARLLPDAAAITAGEVLYYPGTKRARADVTDQPINLLNLSPAELRRFRWSDMAVVFQSAMNALNPVMSLGDQIDDVLRTQRPRLGRGARADRARELLRLVGIASERIGSYPHELS